MKALWQAALLGILNLLLSSHAIACAAPPQPSTLVGLEADAIVIVQVTHAETPTDPMRPWVATASSRGTVWGSVEANEFTFEGAYPGSCWNFGIPKLERYWVLYIRKSVEGIKVDRAAPFWWVRMSGDKRLERLDMLMPLGAARPATPEEEVLINFAEPRVRLPTGATDLSKYTRVYAHSSAGMVRVAILPSRKPQQLIVDSFEEWPTRASCRCEFTEQMIDVQDLRSAGKLPPFDP